jgi:hypothetical protein
MGSGVIPSGGLGVLDKGGEHMLRMTKAAAEHDGLGRELSQGIVLLALTGSSVGGFLGMVAIATRALGR